MGKWELMAGNFHTACHLPSVALVLWIFTFSEKSLSDWKDQILGFCPVQKISSGFPWKKWLLPLFSQYFSTLIFLTGLWVSLTWTGGDCCCRISVTGMHLAASHLRPCGDNLKILSDWQQREEYLVTWKSTGRARGELWVHKGRAAVKTPGF